MLFTFTEPLGLLGRGGVVGKALGSSPVVGGGSGAVGGGSDYDAFDWIARRSVPDSTRTIPLVIVERCLRLVRTTSIRHGLRFRALTVEQRL